MWVEIIIFFFTFLCGYYWIIYKRVHSHFNDRDVRYLPGVPILGNSLKCTFMQRHIIEDLDEVYKAFPDERYLSFYLTHTYYSRFIPVGVAEASQRFLWDAHALPKLFTYIHTFTIIIYEELDSPAVSALSVRSRKLSNALNITSSSSVLRKAR
jgi:hypothetical protein